jgi:hypothetical protein
MPTLGDLAASLGLPVFPCGDHKRPVVEGGFKASASDPAEIRRLFDRPGAALIGMPTGGASGLVVIDLDVRDEYSGLAWLEENADALPPTRRHRTRSGGLHLLFRAPIGVEIRNSASRIAPGVDVRGEGGYVILPPSPGYAIEDGTDPADMPRWLIRSCLPPAPPAVAEAASPRPFPASTDHHGGTVYGLAALEGECLAIQRAPFGRQETTLNAAGLRIGQLVAGGELHEGPALAALLAAGRSMPSEGGREAWSAAEIEKKLRRAVADGKRSPRQAPQLAVIQGGAGRREAPQAGGDDLGHMPPHEDAPPPGEPGGPVVPEAPARTAENACPLVPLGHADGEWHFLDAVGQKRALKSKALTSRGDLVSLFLGDTSWLFEWFPKITKRTRVVDGQKIEEEEVTGFQTSAAGEYLMTQCGAAGLYGSHVVLRGPGVWDGGGGAPVVHCGDAVLTAGGWRASGFRDGNHVWITAAPWPRPGDGAAPGSRDFAAGPEVAQGLQAEIAELWRFRDAGAEIVCLGLLAVGYFGTAARWRPNGYLVGGAGSGKSTLLRLMRACVPQSEYSTDASKAGIEAAIDGKPMQVYLDEAGDRKGGGANILLDVVLSATGGDGTRKLRSSADGTSRAATVACSVIMAAISPPEMGAAHTDRFTILELQKPENGADHSERMAALIRLAEASALRLWGRAIAGWPRFEAGRVAFREALGRHGCLAREMDQLGTILAAWWVLVAEGVPTAAQADDGVAAIAAFVRGAEAVGDDDGPRQVQRFISSSLIQRDRSTDVEQVGVLLEKAFADIGEAREASQRLLERNGIRPVKASDATTANGKPIPRGDLGDGIWFSRSARTLKALFAGSAFEGDRWAFELARLPGAQHRRQSVRVGGASGPAIWVPWPAWRPPGDDEGAPPPE